MLEDHESVTYSLSSSDNNDVTFLVEYCDPRLPRRFGTAICVHLDDVPESDLDAHAFFLARIEQEIGEITDVEALAVCTRMAEEMVWEIKSLRGQD